MKREVTIFTGQWADMPFEDVCKLMSELGYDGLEIACWGDHLDAFRASTDMDYVNEKKQILKKYGLVCRALGNHLAGQCVGDDYEKRLDSFVPADAAGDPVKVREWAVDYVKASAKAAKNMGCYVVTGFMGSPIWKYLYSFPPTPPEMIEAGYDTIIKLWEPILEEFAKNGVKFALEVHPTEIAYDYYTTKKLFEKFSDNKTLGINFDPSHLIWQGMKPHYLIRDFSERIFHVHMKDAAVTLDGRTGIIGSHIDFGDARRGWNFRSLGHGSIDFEEIIRALNDIGYMGPLSVEWEDSGMDRVFGAREACEFVKKIDFPPSELAFDEAMKRK